MSSGRRHRVASDHAPKVFAPFQGIGFATYGSAFIGERTIAGVVEEFAGQRPEQAGTMIAEVSRDAAEFFGRFLTDAFDAIGRDPPLHPDPVRSRQKNDEAKRSCSEERTRKELPRDPVLDCVENHEGENKTK